MVENNDCYVYVCLFVIYLCIFLFKWLLILCLFCVVGMFSMIFGGIILELEMVLKFGI